MNIEFTKEELYQLAEAIKDLRKRIERTYQNQGVFKYKEALQDKYFVQACHLHFKIDKAIDPTSKTTLNDYLNYGASGLSN
jgi:hypothetical protein